MDQRDIDLTPPKLDGLSAAAIALAMSGAASYIPIKRRERGESAEHKNHRLKRAAKRKQAKKSRKANRR